ncbi:hypothetical protein [uncultured Bacteroides sp.]|uniref:hypothetical protein n=1 Tax=uncultured Bacteroides sp. TaxID=162156 RepID=UPI002AABFDE2|nr:hypothetical protein [uncultured Bacteroides sp.]
MYKIKKSTYISEIIITLIQVGATFIVLMLTYMLFALIDYSGGINGFIGITFIQPVFAAIVSFVSIVFCFLLGLPIRLSTRIKHWWIDHFYLPLIIIIVGIVLMSLSVIPFFSKEIVDFTDGSEIKRMVPNLTMIISGWFLTTFSILHTYPPSKLIEKFSINKQ